MNIKNKFKRYLNLIIKDRKYLFVMIAFLIVVFLFMIFSLNHIKSVDSTIFFRYSGFGQTHYYTKKWFYNYSWFVLPIVVLLIHGLGSLKLFGKNMRYQAIVALLLGIMVLVIAYFVVGNIFTLLG